MKLVVNRTKGFDIKVFLLFFLIIMPELFTQIKFLTLLFAALQVLTLFYFGAKLLCRLKFKLEYVYWILISLYLLALMLLNGNIRDIDKWARLLILVLDTMLALDYYVKRNRIVSVLDTVTYLGIFYFAVNTLMLLLTPNGFLIRNELAYFFLGIRTDFLKFFFPFALIGGLDFIYCRQKWKTILLFALAILNFIQCDVSTALVSMAVLAVLLLFKKTISGFVNVKISIMIAVILNIGFLFLNASTRFSWVIVNLLNKDVTLTNRVGIWKIAIQQITESKIGLIFGHGIVNGGAFVEFGLYGGGRFWPAHNQFLQWAFEYGLLGTSAILLFFVFMDRYSDNNNADAYYCHAIFLTMLVSSISSAAFNNHLGYICVCFFPLLKDIRKQAADHSISRSGRTAQII